MSKTLKEKTVSGVFWSSLERFSGLGLEFLVILVLARILTPKDFGLVGMLTIFVAISRSLVDSGFSQALIRKQNRVDEDNCTVFFFNVLVSFGVYVLLFFLAPWVAAFYDEPQLCLLMRVLCLVIVIDSFSVVQRALFTSKIDFKTQTKSSLASSVISGAISIFLAYCGYGYWSLVFYQICAAFINNLILWYYSTWRPGLLFSRNAFRDMFSFGSKLMLSGLIDTVYNNLYQIVIGKFFSASSLGYFSQAKNFSQMPATTITTILQRVTYPTLCSFQDDIDKLKYCYERLLRISAFVVFPLMCGIAGIASPLVNVLIGEKWASASLLIIPLCFSMMWYPIHAINLNILKVRGRSDLFLKIEIIKKVVGVLILFGSIPFGLTIMCWLRVVNALISLAINTYYTGILIDWSFWAQLKSYSRILVISILLFVVVLCATMLFDNQYVNLFIGLLSGLAFFSFSIFVFRFKEFGEIVSLLRSFVKK